MRLAADTLKRQEGLRPGTHRTTPAAPLKVGEEEPRPRVAHRAHVPE